MPNQITNATGLDGVTGWNGDPVISVDEATFGAPNRRVLVGGNGVGSQIMELGASPGVYAFAHFSGSQIFVFWFNGGGDVIGDPVPMPVEKRSTIAARRGIASTYHFARGYFPAPPDAESYNLYVSGPSAAIFRPYASPMSATAERPKAWVPGPHLNPDLALAAWPELIRYPTPESLELEPIPLRKAFAGDSGVPTTRRLAATSRRFVRFDLVLDAIGRDLLDQFWRANHDEFWFVRPDTGDLCVAEWADDGDPKDSGAVPGGRATSVRLLLRDS